MSGVLAFDLGASSGRGIITSLNNDKLNMQEVHRFDNYSIIDEGKIKWDIKSIMQEILFTIKKASQNYVFDSIAVDTWGVDFGILDKNGELIDLPYHYRDKRTEGIIDNVTVNINEASIYKKTGIQIMEINTLFQLYALKQQESEMYNRIDKLLLMPDLINYFLTGEKKSEITIASTTQLFNPKTREWDWDLIKKLGFNDSIFAEIIEPGEIIGYLKEDICKELEVDKKKIIAVGSHDTASAIICTPYSNGEDLFLSSGTWSLIGTQIDEPIINNKAYNFNFSNEFGVDNKITLLKNITGLWLIQEARKEFAELGFDFDFNQISNMASKSKSIELYFDTDSPMLTVPGDIIGKIKRLAEKTGQEIPKTEGELFRSIYENLAFKYREAFGELVDLTGNKYKRIHIVGGGSNAEFLSQSTANILDIEVVAGFSEATALGNSVVQLVGNKQISDIDTAKQLLSESFKTKSYYPKDVLKWNEKYENYKKKKGMN